MKKILFLLIFLVAITGCSQSNNKAPTGFSYNESTSDFIHTPSSVEPLVMHTALKIKSGGEKIVTLGFFNRHNFTAEKATVGITECLDEDGNALGTLPEVNSISTDVKSGKTQGYRSILSLKNADDYKKGTYTCTIAVYKKGATPSLNTAKGGAGFIYGKKQYFLVVK